MSFTTSHSSLHIPPRPLAGLLPALCSALYNLRLVHHQLYHYPCHSPCHTAPSTSPTSSHAGLLPTLFHSPNPIHHDRQPEVTCPRVMTSWCSQTPMTNAVPQGPNVKRHPEAHPHVCATHTHTRQAGREPEVMCRVTRPLPPLTARRTATALHVSFLT